MTYNRKDLAVQVNIKSVKGYTMREIGKLDDRIKRLEYYTVLNALSLDTKTLSIRDSSGVFERFKNGIFADPFNDSSLVRDDREVNINISDIESIAYPSYDVHETTLMAKPSLSTNIAIKGDYAMIDYDEESIGGNLNATTYVNATQAFWKYNGRLEMYPSYDSAKSQTAGTTPQNINIDIAGAFGTYLDATKSSRIQNISSEVQSPVLTRTEGFIDYFSQTTKRTVTDLGVRANEVPYSTGPYVQDLAFLPSIRSRNVAIVCAGLRPNTTVHCYFDRVKVNANCRQGRINPSYADVNGNLDYSRISAATDQSEIILPNGPLNGPFVTDSTGKIFLVFTIPADTFRFGDRVFVITNVDDLNASDAIICRAEATYTASSISVATSSTSFTVKQPIFAPVTTPLPDIVSTWERDNSPSDSGVEGGSGGGGDSDPVAETFTIENTDTTSINNRAGTYLTSIGIYFKSKSVVNDITCCVVETSAGTPDRSRIVSRVTLTPSQVGVSNDSSVETKFTFVTPALLAANKEYAFYLRPDQNDPGYEMWVSEIGGKDILTNNYINAQPYQGVMQVSSNSRSWTTIQSKDIKFKLYKAKFKYSSATLTLTNEKNDYLTLSNTYTITSGVGMSVGDYVFTANSANLSQVYTDTTNYPFGEISYLDSLNNIIHLKKSNGLFNNTALRNIRIYSPAHDSEGGYIPGTLKANSQIYTIDDLPYHSFSPKLTILEPIGTSTSSSVLGTSNSTSVVGSYVKDTSILNARNEQITRFNDYERVLRSYSNEVQLGTFGDYGNLTYRVNLNSRNPYLSPVIDLNTKNIKMYKNNINSNNTNEHTRYGYAINKYVSKVVSLATPAEDLRVYITGYRPAATEIEVYAKFKSNNDNENFDDKAWTKLEFVNNDGGAYTGSLRSNSITDYKELIYSIPKAYTPYANASISGTTMTVHGITGDGLLKVGQTVVGPNVESYTVITANSAGTIGGIGTYTVSKTHTPAIGPVNIFATPSSPSANVAYADMNADGYSNDKLPEGVLTYFDNAYAMQTGFNQFSLKILLLADNPVNVPNMRDVRAIALMI